MNLLIGIGLTFTLFAIFFLLRAVRCTRRGRILRAGGSGLGGAMSAVLAGAALLLAFNYYKIGRASCRERV